MYGHNKNVLLETLQSVMPRGYQCMYWGNSPQSYVGGGDAPAEYRVRRGWKDSRNRERHKEHVWDHTRFESQAKDGPLYLLLLCIFIEWMRIPTSLSVHFSGVAPGYSKCTTADNTCSLALPIFLGMNLGLDFKESYTSHQGNWCLSCRWGTPLKGME